jgi:hypothetical protein
MRGSDVPLAYVYPPEHRAVRDIMRRRSYFVRLKGEVQGHISITNYPYNLPAFETPDPRVTDKFLVAF